MPSCQVLKIEKKHKHIANLHHPASVRTDVVIVPIPAIKGSIRDAGLT